MDNHLKQTLAKVAGFYDQHKVGDVGHLGFRRSTDLGKLLACLKTLLDENIVIPGKTRFLDLGCADGRVNVFLSYLVKISAGIELDEWTLDEYGPLKTRVETLLKQAHLPLPPKNIFLFLGDSTHKSVQQQMTSKTGLSFEDFDLFYTYLVMHEEFADLIRAKAKRGAVFMVYGLEKVLPRYPGFELLDHLSPLEGILALYKKV